MPQGKEPDATQVNNLSLQPVHKVHKKHLVEICFDTRANIYNSEKLILNAQYSRI